VGNWHRAQRAAQSWLASCRFTAEDFVRTYSAAEILPTAEIFQTTMRAVVQRVSHARVTADGSVTGEIAMGLLILLGVGHNDTSAVAASTAEKMSNLRIFEDEAGKMNRSLLDVKGSALVVSQFTLYGDARGQRRPSFVAAAPPEQAKNVYEQFAEALRRLGVTVATGVFGAMMSVELVNEGPVTIILDSEKTF
jgi:D-aminoacyl-tRNA deacylase